MAKGLITVCLALLVVSSMGDSSDLKDSATRVAARVEEKAAQSGPNFKLKRRDLAVAKIRIPKREDVENTGNREVEAAYVHFKAIVEGTDARVEIIVYRDADTARDSMRFGLSRMTVGPASPILGIGVEAFRATEEGGTLFFWRGPVAVQVSSTNPVSLQVAKLIDDAILELR